MESEILLREALKRPLLLPYHPLFRFYRGGSLVRKFRGIPNTEDDWYSEDWVGSCTLAANPDSEEEPQGLSMVEVPEVGAVPLKRLVEIFPEEMLGAEFAATWGTTPGVLVKILSPAMPVPLHFHPSRPWAREHLNSRFGKTEGWILLETLGAAGEAPYFAAGFKQDVDREWFLQAIKNKDHQTMRDLLHREQVTPGEMYVAHPGVPHCMGPQILSIELQEPTDHMVVAEFPGDDDTAATMGLGWDVALDILDCGGVTQEAAFDRARQRTTVLRQKDDTSEIRLVNPEVLEFFDATRLDIAAEIAVEDGRFYIGIVTGGEGAIEGDFGRMDLAEGMSFACAASLGHRFTAGARALQVVRCLGPTA